MRPSAGSPEVLTFADFEADLRSRDLRRNGSRVRLTDQSFQVLAMLLKRPGDLVTREELKNRLWTADTFVDFDRGLNNAVNRLRDALGDSADVPRFIETLPRRGYRFIAPVGTNAPVVTPSPSRQKHALRIALAGSLLLVVATAILLGLNVRGWHDRLFPTRNAVHSLAVLPLDDLSGDTGQEYFADGITDELITEMAQLRPLRVISRTSVMRYKGARKPLPEIASELGVDAILEGSVTRSGQQVRITAQLIEARSDTHLWSGEYTRELRDIISLQREVAWDIAQQTRLQLLPEQRARLATARPVDPEAYELFLRGLHFWDLRTVESMQQGLVYFSESANRDPGFAPTWAYISMSHSILHDHEAAPPQVGYPKALEAAKKALQLDPMSAEAHSAMASVHWLFEWDAEGCMNELRKAIELDPNYGLAHQWYSNELIRLGQPELALEEMRRALAVDPVSLRVNLSYAARLLEARQYAAAINQLSAALALYPAEGRLRRPLADAYERAGNEKRAAQEFGKYLAGDEQGRAFRQSCQPFEYRRCEQLFTAQEAKRDLAALDHRRKEGLYVSPASFADAYLRLGDKRKAIHWLEAAYEERSTLPLSFAMPQFDTLRAEPAFHALMARVGLPQAVAFASAK